MPSTAARAATLQNTYGAKLGDRQCLAELFEAHSEKLRRHLRTRTDDECAADDAAQEAWLKVARSIGDFDPTRGTFQTWLFSIGRNALKDTHKSGYSRRENVTADMLDHDTASGDDTEAATESRMANARLAAEVKALPANQRAVLAHRFYTNLSYAETADLMGLTVSSVKSLQWRGLRNLARQLGDDIDNVFARFQPDTTTAIRVPRSQEAPA